MLGLGKTTANLARQRRHWDKLLSATGQGSAQAFDAGPARLSEVTGFGSNPGDLTMLAYVPDLLPRNPALVVVLHGCGQTAAGYDHGTGWSALADRHGFVVLMPEQKQQNNANKCFNWFEAGDTVRGGGEALSIRQMIERASIDHGVDPRRIFVTGLSAGGAMTSVMLATYPEVFAGGAIIAGLPYRCATGVQDAFQCMFQGRARSAREWGNLVRAASPHKGPWPRISVWHGGADTTVKAMNAEEVVKQWTDIHGLSPAPTLEAKVNGYPHQVWRDRNGKDVIESYTITGMAHGTPIYPGTDQNGRGGAAAPYILDVGISSTHQIARFWGVIDERSASADDLQEQTASPPKAEPRSRTSHSAPGAFDFKMGTLKVDPKSIITKALGAAGLIRGSGDKR